MKSLLVVILGIIVAFALASLVVTLTKSARCPECGQLKQIKCETCGQFKNP